jgi:hypothetical protein
VTRVLSVLGRAARRAPYMAGAGLASAAGERLQGAVGDSGVAVDGAVPDGGGHGRLAGQQAVEGVGGHGDHRVAVRCRTAADGELAGVGAEVEGLRSYPQLAGLPVRACVVRPARPRSSSPQPGWARVVLGTVPVRSAGPSPAARGVCGCSARPASVSSYRVTSVGAGRVRRVMTPADCRSFRRAAEDVAGDARQAGREVTVPARAQTQLPHEEQAPPFADDVQGPGDGARLPIALHKKDDVLYFYKCQVYFYSGHPTPLITVSLG